MRAPPSQFLSVARGRLSAAFRDHFSLDVRSLAAFRVALGALLIADAVLRTRDFSLMFAADGIFPPRLIRGYFGDDPADWSLALLLDDSRWAAVILALEAVAGGCLAAGWNTTLATMVAWIAQVSVFRRTIPAANAGDLLLSCLLFWSCFLPLGKVWSIDARRRAHTAGGPTAAAICGPATMALMFQVMAVYVGAGLSKWNSSWLAGTAVRHALSVHDHGTPLGMWLAGCDWFAQPMTWGVLATEIAAPLVFLAWPAARPALVIAFMLFHIAIWMTMSVGLFAPIGLVAWLPLVPSILWGGAGPVATAFVAVDCPRRWARWLCVAAAGLAAVSFTHDRTRGPGSSPLPGPVRQAIHAVSLTQEWGMFGTVPPLEQWSYARAELADGRVIDLLRGGRPLEPERPAGGFTSLPHHRWHKLLWILPRPGGRPFAASVAAALAREWNERHAAGERAVAVEIRFAQHNVADPQAPLLEMLVGCWPERDAAGSGNLDRLLETDRVETDRFGTATP